MKRVIALLTVVGMAACAAGPSREAREIVNNGAKVKETFRVTDSQGHPVTNANVNVLFQFLGGLKDYFTEYITRLITSISI